PGRRGPVAMAQADGAAPLRVCGGGVRGQRRRRAARPRRPHHSSPAGAAGGVRADTDHRLLLRRGSRAVRRRDRDDPLPGGTRSRRARRPGASRTRRLSRPVRDRAGTGAMILEMRLVRGLVVAATGAMVAVVVTAQPAAAHDPPGIKPSSLDTPIRGTTPRVAGLTVPATDLENELEPRDATRADVVVLGYQSEPYL